MNMTDDELNDAIEATYDELDSLWDDFIEDKRKLVEDLGLLLAEAERRGI